MWIRPRKRSKSFSVACGSGGMYGLGSCRRRFIASAGVSNAVATFSAVSSVRSLTGCRLLPNLPKELQKKCADRKEAMPSDELQLDAQAMREGPMWRDGHYRFEFDVVLSKPELVKMLWLARDRNDKVLTSPANDGAGLPEQVWWECRINLDPVATTNLIASATRLWRYAW